MSASSFLSYGGILKLVRVDDNNLKNARVGYNTTATADIKNFDDYNNQETANYHYAAKTPGTWANGLKVCVIDDKADQIIGITTTNLGNMAHKLVYGITMPINTTIAGSGSTSVFTGHLKGIITGVTTSTTGNSTIDVKVVSRVSSAGTETQIDYAAGTEYTSFVVSKHSHLSIILVFLLVVDLIPLLQ